MKGTDALRMELHNAWSRKLCLWWRHYNQEYLSGGLKQPVIRLGEGGKQLGCWDGGKRILTISQEHIRRDPWLSVMDTLRHEMAHQYVDEVLQAEGEGPHGAAFQEACRRLRCLPRATHRSTHTRGHGKRLASPEDRILTKIKKVLTLTSSPNQNEAEVAVEKARQLLVKYSLDLVELDQERCFESRSLGVVRKRRRSYELWLASILSDFFFVEVLWAESYEALSNRTGSILQIFGTPAHLEMAEYVYHYLEHLLEQLWRRYRGTSRLASNRERQRYLAGLLEGFYRKLQQQQSRLEQTQALVWKGDPQLERFFRYLNPRVRTRYWGGVSQSRVYRDGMLAGRRVTIHKPVGEKTPVFGGYLKG